MTLIRKTKKEVEIQIPITPNYLRVGLDVLPISDFTEVELKAVAKVWTMELLEKRIKKNEI